MEINTEPDKVNSLALEGGFKETEPELETLFNTMVEGVMLLDARGKIVRVNTAAARFIGLKQSDIENRYYNDKHWVMLKPDRTPFPCEGWPVTRALSTHRTQKNVEMGMQRPDGSVSWFTVNVVPVLDRENRLTGVVSVFIDITEPRKLRDEREYYVAEVTRAQEEERKRIARELHDGVGQSLTGLCLELDAAGRDLDRPRDETRQRLKELRTRAEGIIRELRTFSHQLRPGTLDHLSLASALGSLIFEMNATGDIQVSCEVSGPEQKLSAETELALYRIAQEALNNVRKHSLATKVDVALNYRREKVRLTIADNGCGFQMPEEGNFGILGRLGLVTMKERARLIGGVLSVKSRPDRGTTITADVPTPRKSAPS